MCEQPESGVPALLPARVHWGVHSPTVCVRSHARTHAHTHTHTDTHTAAVSMCVNAHPHTDSPTPHPPIQIQTKLQHIHTQAHTHTRGWAAGKGRHRTAHTRFMINLCRPPRASRTQSHPRPPTKRSAISDLESDTGYSDICVSIYGRSMTEVFPDNLGPAVIITHTFKELQGRGAARTPYCGQHAGPWAVPFPSRGLDRPPSGPQAHRPSTIFALFPYGPAGPPVR
jgi:hypothetical protein